MPNTEWKDGDLITAERLNAMMPSAFVIDSAYDETADGYKMDHTWQEICDATLAGKQCILVTYDTSYDPPTLQHIYTALDIEANPGGNEYAVVVHDPRAYGTVNKYIYYGTDSIDGYPTYYAGD